MPTSTLSNQNKRCLSPPAGLQLLQVLLAEPLDLAALGGGAAAGGLEQAGPEVRVRGLAGARRLLRRAHPHAAALVHQRRLARAPRRRRALRDEGRRQPLVPRLQRLVEERLDRGGLPRQFTVSWEEGIRWFVWRTSPC